MEIRMIQKTDARQFMMLNEKLDRETNFMMLEPEERNMQVEFYQQQVESIRASGNSMIFIADNGNELAGYMGLFGGRYKRIRHSAHIVIGLLKKYRGMGLGTAIFETAEEWATDIGLTRLELTVVSDNKPALGLYKKRGFEIEGLKKNSLVINGEYFDEYYMAKML